MAGGSRVALIIIITAGLLFIGIQLWGTIESSRHSRVILNQIQALQQDQLTSEKTRQEVIALSIENETKALIQTGLVSSIGALVAVFVALFGIWQGLRDYWVAREKERLDRASVDLNKIWEGMANQDARARAGAIVGLQHYLSPDKSEYHPRILSALAVAARMEQQPEVLNTIILAIQQGLHQVPCEMAHSISWQGLKLRRINLAGINLTRFDFRDADLEEADLRDCNLSEVLFNAAILKGARMDGSKLRGANLEYADLAGASLIGADLTKCNLTNAMILNINLQKADLREAIFEPEEVDWKLTKNWRNALFSGGLSNKLIKRYGPDTHGSKVLMMLWEFPPLAAGGAWTAAYHILWNLRRQGANLLVMVPWEKKSLHLELFGNEVEFATMEIIPPVDQQSPYEQGLLSAYRKPYSIYGGSSVYEKPYLIYGQPTSLYRRGRFIKEEPIGGIVREFQNRALRYVQHTSFSFDVVYAPDWPTFWAAEEVSRVTGKPWIAHFHSTENDRRRQNLDEIIVAIERRGARAANYIVTPSKFTAGEVLRLYDIPATKISVMPNPLSEEDIPVSETGSFDTKRVIFVGRLAWQKGPDVFVQMCDALKKRMQSANFNIFGEGEESPNIERLIYEKRLDIRHSGFIDWESRGTVYSSASAVLVPSRAEPFGMVILEGMQRGVPVLYPQHSGAAEVLTSGIKINPEDIDGTVDQLYRLLNDREYWENIVKNQTAEINMYYSKGFESILLKLFSQVPNKP